MAQNAEQKMHLKLVNLFQEPHFDNQDALRTLFGLRNDWPLKQSNEQPKVSLTLKVKFSAKRITFILICGDLLKC